MTSSIDAYKQGAIAREEGKAQICNPFVNGSEPFAAWALGWAEAPAGDRGLTVGEVFDGVKENLE